MSYIVRGVNSDITVEIFQSTQLTSHPARELSVVRSGDFITLRRNGTLIVRSNTLYTEYVNDLGFPIGGSPESVQTSLVLLISEAASNEPGGTTGEFHGYANASERADLVVSINDYVIGRETYTIWVYETGGWIDSGQPASFAAPRGNIELSPPETRSGSWTGFTALAQDSVLGIASMQSFGQELIFDLSSVTNTFYVGLWRQSGSVSDNNTWGYFWRIRQTGPNTFNIRNRRRVTFVNLGVTTLDTISFRFANSLELRVNNVVVSSSNDVYGSPLSIDFGVENIADNIPSTYTYLN